MSAPKACVIGWPVTHSRSPLIHGYWLNALGINGSYEKAGVSPQDFPKFIEGSKGNGFVGGNVTVPHKGAAAHLCHRLTKTAARLGSVNTLWFEGDELWGDTTDGRGFLCALDQDAPGWDARRALALVVGAGGAAAPIIDALQQRGFARIVVANRTLDRAQALAKTLQCDATSLSKLSNLMRRCDLLVNATSLGMSGQGGLDLELDTMPPHAVVDDIVYVPSVTSLLERAHERGLRTVGGLGMLLHQAVPGFARWFGRIPQVTTDLREKVLADIQGA